MKHYFVFSDIHGNLKPLVDALDQKGFDLENENHILISLGDNFDRGIENIDVLGFLKYFNRLNRLIMIRGNHDDFLLDFLTGKSDGLFNIKHNGLGNTLREFSDPNAKTIEEIRDSINRRYPFLIELLESMVPKFELGKYEFIHAGYEYSNEKDWYIYNFANTPYFIKYFKPYDKTYVFGHFHVQALNYYELGKESDEPFRKKGFIGVDAKTIITKKVNVLVFDENGNEIEGGLKNGN
ncbi:metallophosphoesterase [Acholeplasma equirhinis]|uniref:metallophosphoesterase n=1 Tax=Acholeplasma equirhinis TaxID=555393 RepID=UPI00197AAEF0|nr:metallophosphoesterase [Acholeplasma equirhinis]MBN3490624.1 metallophosphoesterase [Acholeplasma equirhinis]